MGILEAILGFLIGKVILQYIIGHWIANQIIKYSSVYFQTRPTRIAALWFHFMERVNGQEHNKDLSICHYRRCAVL